MKYLEGLRKASLHAINCLAYGSAYSILDLGLAYMYPQGLPNKKAHALWEARCSLNMCLACTDSSIGIKDPDGYWTMHMDEAVKTLKEAKDIHD